MVPAVALSPSRQDIDILAGDAPATPAQFLAWLHGDLRHRVCVLTRVPSGSHPDGAVYRDHTIRRDDLALQLACPDLWLESPDTYVMINETRRQRLAADVVCLKAFVVDLDCHHDDDPAPEFAKAQALVRLDQAGLPRPHLAVETGRGVQLIWRLDRVGLKRSHRNAQVRWAKTQQALAKICGPQADLSLVDLPRVIRLPGTVNSKAPPSRRTTRSTWVEGASKRNYGFDDLCDAALGVERRTFVARYVAKPASNDASLPSADAAAEQGTTPAKKERRGPSGATGFGSMATIAAARLRDLEKIAERFFMSGIPEGHRDTFIMSVATDMAWTTPLAQADAFAGQVIHALKRMGCVVDERTHGGYRGRANAPMSVTEARRNLGSVIRRFRDAAVGAKTEFGGQLRDPRYWYGTERKWSLIAPMISGDHELLARLEELLPKHLRARRRAAGAGEATAHGDRPARDRVAEGRYKRARATTSKREEILAALDGGMAVREAAALAGVTARTIYNWLATRTPDGQVSAAPVEVEVEALAQAPMTWPAPDAAPSTEPVVKKRPLPYMALPGVLPPPPAEDKAPLPASCLQGGIQNMVGQPECGQPAGLSITEGVSLGGGQPQNRLAGHPQVRPVDGGVVHAREGHGGFVCGGARGGGHETGVGLARSPAQQQALAPAAGKRQALSMAEVLSAMARAGSPPSLPRRRSSWSAGAGADWAGGAAGGAAAAGVRSEHPAASGADGLAQLPPVALNDDDFGVTDSDD